MPGKFFNKKMYKSQEKEMFRKKSENNIFMAFVKKLRIPLI